MCFCKWLHSQCAVVRLILLLSGSLICFRSLVYGHTAPTVSDLVLKVFIPVPPFALFPYESSIFFPHRMCSCLTPLAHIFVCFIPVTPPILYNQSFIRTADLCLPFPWPCPHKSLLNNILDEYMTWEGTTPSQAGSCEKHHIYNDNPPLSSLLPP